MGWREGGGLGAGGEEEKKKESKCGRGGKRVTGVESFTWRQAAFQYPTADHTNARTRTIDTMQKWHRSPFGDFPSSEIRLDICPPPRLSGSSTEADSQIKIARGTIQTLLPFCRECLLTALDLRG